MAEQSWQRYSYTIDPNADSTANKILRLVGNNKRVLEIGCGPGAIAKALKEYKHCTVSAVEIDAEMAAIAEPFCERMIVSDLETLNYEQTFADEKFDVIVAADVLEHLCDPWRCLEQVRALLNDEGYIVISIPNIAHSAAIAQLLAGRFPYQEKGLLDYTHLRFFTRADLEHMLLSSGFLPSLWERNLVPSKQTEFASQWRALPQTLQDALATAAEGDTYQFIVKAYPSTQAGWLAKNQTEHEQVHSDHQALAEQLTTTQADLAEHQKAFSEARQIIAAREHEIEGLRKELLDTQKALHSAAQEYQVALNKNQQIFNEAHAMLKHLQSEQTLLIDKTNASQLLLNDMQRSFSRRIVSFIRRALYRS